MSSRRRNLTAQQRAVLLALIEQSPMPTTILRDVRVREGDMYAWSARPERTYAIGEPVGAVLRRLEKRGLVTGETGSTCKDWWISDLGLEVMGFSR
jgi:hypothetical protein